MKPLKLLQTVALATLIVSFSSAGFGASWWSLSCGTTHCSNDDASATADGITVDVTAVGDSDAGKYADRSLYSYGGGLGSGAAEGESNPEHAFDFSKGGGATDGIHEFMVASFTTSVALEFVEYGWVDGYTGSGDEEDADTTVLAWSGGTFNANSDLKGQTAAQLAASGDWQIFNVDLFNEGLHSIGNGSGGSGFTSTVWLIGAYNSAFGGGLDQHDEFFKISALKGTEKRPPETETQVPVPSTALLLGLGLLMVRARTRS